VVEKRWRQWDKEFLRRVRDEGLKDQDYVTTMDSLRGGNKRADQILHEEDGILFRQLRLWIPSSLRADVLVSEYDSQVAGHMGQDKMMELIRRNFWWVRMNEDIVKYIQAWVECQRNKSARHKPYGLLQPLELAYAPWQSIVMDLITDRPLSDGCDQLWVVIDRYTKMSPIIPLKKNSKKAPDLAVIFAKEILRLYGLPSDIISDRRTPCPSIPSALVFHLRDIVTLVTFVSIANWFKTSLAVLFVNLTPCQNSDLTNEVVAGSAYIR
jgi:hypothetical protein